MSNANLIIILCLILAAIYLLHCTKSTESFTNNNPKPEDIVSQYDGSKGFTAGLSSVDKGKLATAEAIIPPGVETGGEAAPLESVGEIDSSLVKAYSQKMADNLNTKDFNVKDFLPQEINDDWFNTDLSKAQNELDQATLIDVARFCQGVDTVGQSLKNPSYDIRGNIPNPKVVVSPFLNSSYDPDTNIKSWN